jgi:O-methyltransferase
MSSPANSTGGWRIRLRDWQTVFLPNRLARAWSVVSLPAAILYLLWSHRIDPAYHLNWARRVRLGWRMWRTTRGVWTGTSYKAHLAMAVKLLEIPPDVEGVVVECGCYVGGSSANLSLACEAAGRKLIVYDSFEGLPEPTGNDEYARQAQTGFLRGDLDVVKANVARFGRIERCTFRKGWFSDTLPGHREPVVLAFLDVDYQASLDDCIRNLWPHLTERGYLFTDEYIFTEFCALFWSERYWRETFDAEPPGLIGSGSGIGVGQFYLGPSDEWNYAHDPGSVAYTRKDLCGRWSYDPDAPTPPDEARAPVGGPPL